MPRRKPIQPKKSAVPDYIQETPTWQKRKITKRKLPSFEEAMFLIHVPELAREYFASILEGLKRGDKVALEHTGEMLNYVQRRGFNINIAQQLNQQATAAGITSPVMGFDALARQLAEARAGHALPPPADVIDIDIVRAADSAPAGD